ncbi:hypothetical protein GGX14DRAFT_700206 [Mycena pura]|uniref:Uncharacterized protein n=1 Tax=Mycena pura TaxID=153505 RepID=A0AAD6UY33_9AGAR|nr:hypothetical protein GGX14DRAFT_700206 [Mycena pura]
MSTTQDRVHALGVYTCPPELPMDVFVDKCSGFMDAILATSAGHKIVRYEMLVPNKTIDEHLEQLKMPVSQKTIIIVAEFAILNAAKEEFGIHLESRTFAYDIIVKKWSSADADVRQQPPASFRSSRAPRRKLLVSPFPAGVRFTSTPRTSRLESMSELSGMHRSSVVAPPRRWAGLLAPPSHTRL